MKGVTLKCLSFGHFILFFQSSVVLAMFISSLDLLTIHGLCTTKNWYLSLIVRRVKLFFYFVEDNVDRSS